MTTTLAAAILLAGMGQVHEQGDLISLDLPITRVDKILDAINKQAGTRLATTGDSSRHFLFVQVKKMPLPRLKDLLAEVLEGEWTKSGGKELLSTTLVHSKQALDAKARLGVDAFFAKAKPRPPMTLAEVDAMIRKGLELRRPLPNGGFDYRSAFDLSMDSVHERLMRRIALSLGREALASVHQGETHVFAAVPTRWQKPLPAGARREIEAFREALPAYAARARSLASPLRNGELYVHAVEALAGGLDAFDGYLVEVTRSPYSHTVKLILYGKDGAAQEVSLAIGSRDTYEDSSDPHPFATPRTVVRFAPGEAQLILDLTTWKPQSNQLRPMSGPAFQAIVNAEQQDILTLYPTKFLRAAAKMKGTNVVAFVPDVMMFPDLRVRHVREGEMELTHALESLLVSSPKQGWNVREHPDALVILAPGGWAEKTAAMRLSRSESALLVREAREKGMTMDLAAQIALSAYEGSLLKLARDGWICSAAQDLCNSQYDFDASKALRVFGRLPVRRAAFDVQESFSMPLSVLSGQLLEEVKKMVFAEGTRLAAPNEKAIGDDDQSPALNMRRDSLDRHPTVALAPSWPQDSSLVVSIKSSPCLYFFPTAPDLPGYLNQPGLQEAKPDALARDLLSLEKDRNDYPTDYRLLFGMGQSEELTVVVDFGRLGKISDTFRLHRMARSGPRFELKDAPGEFRTQVAAAMEAERRKAAAAAPPVPVAPPPAR